MEKLNFLVNTFAENDELTNNVFCLQEMGTPEIYGIIADDYGSYTAGSVNLEIGGKDYVLYAGWADTPNLRCGTGILYENTANFRNNCRCLGDDSALRPYICVESNQIAIYSIHAIANRADAVSQVRNDWKNVQYSGKYVVFAGDMNHEPKDAIRVGNLDSSGHGKYPATNRNSNEDGGWVYAPLNYTHNSDKVLDYFILNERLYSLNKNERAEVYDSAGYSDHNIVQLTINFNS